MKIVIIKYNAGNIRSVDFALQRLGVSALITADPEEIRSADRVIFPGVGEASTTMSYLKYHKLDTLIRDLRQPNGTAFRRRETIGRNLYADPFRCKVYPD